MAQKIILEITMSLDGFIAGPNTSKAEPMGIGGHELHQWLFNNKTGADVELTKEITETIGAVIVGANTYVNAIEDAWDGKSPFEVPAFVISHTTPAVKVEGFEYVNNLISALEKAKAAAGEKNVWIMGGANIIQQYLQKNLFDEIHLHIAPMLLFTGTKLFESFEKNNIRLKKLKVIDTSAATHLYYEILKIS